MNLRHKSLVGTLVSLKRLTNSQNGNPRYRVTLASRGGTVVANTAADHSFAYAVGNPGMREGSWVRVSIGGRGTIVDIETAGSGAAFGDAMARWGRDY